MLARVGGSQEADMGLLDILNSVPAAGVSNDPRARAAPRSQGMSPTAKALLALLAIYAMKNLRRADAPPTQPGRPAGGNVSAGVPGGQGGTLGGGLGDLLRGTLGGILGGAAAGTVLNAGPGAPVQPRLGRDARESPRASDPDRPANTGAR